MTPQEIFDRAYLGIIKQGKPSMASDKSCLYRGPDGTACGVGILLTDEEAEGLDNFNSHITSVDRLFAKGLLPDWITDDNINLLKEIQFAHDGSAAYSKNFVSDFKISMGIVAEKFSLAIPPTSDVSP